MFFFIISNIYEKKVPEKRKFIIKELKGNFFFLYLFELTFLLFPFYLQNKKKSPYINILFSLCFPSN